jgi:hypothetical protein
VNLTNVFVVDTKGELQRFYADENGVWSNQQLGQTNAPAGVSLAAVGQQGGTLTDVLLVDSAGQLVNFPGNAGAWPEPAQGSSPISSANLAPPGAAVCAVPQLALARTVVFVADTAGAVQLFWVDGAGAWQGPAVITASGFTKPGAPLTASPQFGADLTDVFVVDNSGTVQVFWEIGGGVWQGPGAVSQSGFAPPGAPLAVSRAFGLNRTDVFVADNDGTVQVFWINNDGAWEGPNAITPSGFTHPAAVVAACQEVGWFNETQAYVARSDGVLCGISYVDGGWLSPLAVSSTGVISAASGIATALALPPPFSQYHPALKVEIRLANFDSTFFVTNQGANLPYLWVIFFKIDGDTVSVGSDFQLQGQAQIYTRAGNHGDIGSDLGEIWPIPDELGYFQTTLKPISFGEIVAAPGYLGCVCLVLQDFGSPDYDVSAGHDAFNSAFTTAINNFIPTLGPMSTTIGPAQVAMLQGQITTAVTAAMTNALSTWDKIQVGVIGSEGYDIVVGGADSPADGYAYLDEAAPNVGPVFILGQDKLILAGLDGIPLRQVAHAAEHARPPGKEVFTSTAVVNAHAWSWLLSP